MLNLFLKKKSTQGETVEQKDVNRYFFNEGFLKCSECDTQIFFKDYMSLKYEKCPKCETENFIPLKLDKYWLFSPIGDGGMGVVYKAIDSETVKEYAVKIINKEDLSDEDAGEALIKEAKVGMEVSAHSNICTVFGYGQVDDEFYVVTDIINGERLDEYVVKRHSNGGIEEEKVLLWGLQLLSALQHIYDCGYLYRDLKPQNIMVINDAEDVILFDFGLCLELNLLSEKVEDEMIEGSPQYFPPERCNAELEGIYSEIYSLGMVLFFCLAGEPYYNSDNAMELLKQHTAKLRVSNISKRLYDYNPDIVAIVEKMIKREPEERFQSYREAYIAMNDIYKMYVSCGTENLDIW